MKDDNSELRWDKSKKDKRDADRAAKDQKAEQEAKQKKALLLASELYEKWKRSLLKRKKTTADDLVTLLENLKEQVEAALATAKLDDWKPMVLDMITEKVGRIIAGQIADVNHIKEVLPSMAKDKGVVAHEARIRTEADFKEIPFIKRISEKDSFVGFLRDYPRLWALFDDGELFECATISSEVGLEQIQTLSDYSTAFAKNQRKN